MFVSIINDCRDPNAMNRQAVRAAHLLRAPVTTVGVSNDIEAAGNIIDTLDAVEGEEGVILANVAPRHGKAKKWPNGTPFGFIKHNKTYVFATVDGLTLSLIKKFELASRVQVFDIPSVIDYMISKGQLPQEKRSLIVDSQFRSFEFLPRVAAWVLEGHQIPTTPTKLVELFSSPKAVWWVDNFGNCKTTLLANEVDYEVGKKLQTSVGEITCYYRLKDVPDNEPGIIVGSSGLDSRRFLELVVQGKSAAQRFNLQSGSVLFP